VATRTETPPSTSLASVSFDRSGRQLTAYITGELDAASMPAVSQAISDQIRPDDERIGVDLSTLSFCDSSGILMFFRLERAATEAGARFALYQPTPAVRRVLEMCDASGVLKIRT
jgi:anti-sigma B factor antagonist